MQTGQETVPGQSALLSLGVSLLAEASGSEELLAGSALDSALDSLAASLLDADDELAVLCDALDELPDVPDDAEVEEELPDELLEELCALELLSLLEEAVLCTLLELEDEDVLPEDAPELLELDELLELPLPMMLMVRVLLLTEQSL